jgi:hypothetical protein
MLWEMALHRVSSVTLGLMGAVTPVLSTLNLVGLFALTAPGRVSGSQMLVLLAAALMVGAAVAVGTSPSAERAQSGAGRV